jgi:hypothetical protein
MYKAEDIFYAAQKIMTFLAVPAQARISTLLHQAEIGQDTSNQILDILTDDPDTQRWLRGTLPRYQNDEIMRGHQPVGGDVGDVPASDLLVCPEQSCSFDYLVRHAGIRVLCPIHHVQLIPADQKENT